MGPVQGCTTNLKWDNFFSQRSLGCILFSVGTRTNWHICKGWIRTVDYLSFSDSWHFSWPWSRPKMISFSLLRDHHSSATLFNVVACPYNHIDVFFITNELVIIKLCKSSSNIKHDKLFCFCFFSQQFICNYQTFLWVEFPNDMLLLLNTIQ